LPVLPSSAGNWRRAAGDPSIRLVLDRRPSLEHQVGDPIHTNPHMSGAVGPSGVYLTGAQGEYSKGNDEQQRNQLLAHGLLLPRRTPPFPYIGGMGAPSGLDSCPMPAPSAVRPALPWLQIGRA